jgi:AraC-like DNA-binding protein
MDLIWINDRIVIAGPATTTLVVTQEAGRSSAGLRFVSGTLPGLLGVPANELRDDVVDLDEFRPGATARWSQALAESKDPTLTLRRVLTPAPQNATPLTLLHRVRRLAALQWPAARIADDVGYSARHLQRLCNDSFGYGPKTLGRVLRFVVASGSLRQGGRAGEVAALAGYADQPHMIREFRALTGHPPSWFARPSGEVPRAAGSAQRGE